MASHSEGGLVSLMKRSWLKKMTRKTSSHDILERCGVSLWSQMLKQTPRSVDLGIVYSSHGLQRQQAQAVPTTLPQSPWRQSTFDWELSRLITKWGSGFYAIASLYLLPFHSCIGKKYKRETNRETNRETDRQVLKHSQLTYCRDFVFRSSVHHKQEVCCFFTHLHRRDASGAFDVS